VSTGPPCFRAVFGAWRPPLLEAEARELITPAEAMGLLARPGASSRPMRRAGSRFRAGQTRDRAAVRRHPKQERNPHPVGPIGVRQTGQRLRIRPIVQAVKRAERGHRNRSQPVDFGLWQPEEVGEHHQEPQWVAGSGPVPTSRSEMGHRRWRRTVACLTRVAGSSYSATGCNEEHSSPLDL
jgi:hypothetical protein